MDGSEITGAADNSDQQLARSLKTFASFGGLGSGMLGGWGGGGGSAFLEDQMCWKGCLPNTPRSRRTEVSICRSCCLKDRFYLCLFLTIEDFFFQITLVHSESPDIKDGETTSTLISKKKNGTTFEL